MPIVTEDEPEDGDEDAPCRVSLVFLSRLTEAYNPTVCSAHYRRARDVSASHPSLPCSAHLDSTILLIP